MSFTGERLRRVIAAPLTLIMVVALASQVSTGPAAAAGQPAKPRDVKGVKVHAIAAKARPSWTAQSREVTAKDASKPQSFGGEQVVDLGSKATVSGRGRQAGKLPVFLAPPAGDSGAVGKVRVKYLPEVNGFNGTVLQLSRADGIRSTGRARLTVDYASLRGRYNGDALTRLHLVDIATGAPFASTNDVRTGTVSAMVSLSAATTGVGVAAAAAGPNGDYTATSLTPASTWQVSQQTGAFSWAYPIKVPAAVGNLAPSLSLSYNSADIDGRTAATNTQGSWIGDGWSLWPGFVERSYRGCTDDRDTKEKKDPNNADANGGDLCYFDDNATVSLNGSAVELVKVAGSYSGSGDKNVQYRGTADDGSLIEMISDGRANGDVDGTYWRETTTDGTQYYFGRDAGQGGSSAGTETDSVFTAPIYSNHPDEPGYDKDFAKSRNTRGWRWNLDYVVDRSGNTITYYYGKETGAYAREGDQDKRVTYDRGGYLKRVEYGSRADDPATVHPAARVVFATADRCNGDCYDGDNKPVAAAFPDTPWDQYCDAAPCKTQFAPTFWTQRRLAGITTQSYAGSGDDYTDVDSWALTQTYLSAGGNEGSPMWLKNIVHKGLTTSAGGPAVTDPPVVFDPNADLMPNRVDSTTDGHSSLYRDRIQAVTTESGAQIGVSYSAKECTRDNLPKPWNNTMRCFPQFYGAEGETPKLDWFHKYVVTRVDVYDQTGGFDHQQTNYDYLDKPAWAYDDSELVKPKKRTWGQFRGYGDVRVRQGLEAGTQSATEYRYFRGMDGDRQPKTDELPPTGTPRKVSITDAYGTVADHLSFAGMLREQIVTNGPGGDWVSGTVTTPEHLAATAVDGPLSAWPTHVASTRNRTRLSTGATRWTSTQTRYDSLNYPVEVNDLGDEATADDDRCTTSEYVRNTDAGILGTVKRTLTVGLKCGTTYAPADVLADTRTYYDDPADTAFGKAPDRGLVSRVDQLASWKGTEPQFVKTQVTDYDAVGRVTSITDALGRKTRTAFTPTTSGPVTQVVITDPKNQTVTTKLDRNLAVPLTTSDDANKAVTELRHDGAGRLLAYWLPGRSSTANPDEPNATFTYQLRSNAPTAVTTRTLTGYASKTYRTSIALFDGLLRQRQTQTQTVNGGRAILDTVYDSRGLLGWTSNPYYDYTNAAPDTTLVTADNRPEIPATTQNVYDGAGRLTDAVFETSGTEDWRTHTAYAGEKVSVTPPLGGTATTTITDARGHTVEARQYKDPNKVGTDTAGTYDAARYTFNKQGLLSKIVDQGTNTWTYGYDVRGRQTSADDPDHGTTISTYDDAGQLSTTTNAGHKIAYTYDDLGRKTSQRKDTTDGAKYAEWIYDDLANGAGKLSKSIRYDPPGSTSAYTTAVTGYDAGGRPTGSTITVPPSETGFCVGAADAPCSHTVTQTHKINGDPSQTKFPALAGLAKETLLTSYNPTGLVDSLIGGLSAGNELYAQNTWSQFDQLTGQLLGSDIDQVQLLTGYDDNTGRLKSFSATPRGKADVYSQGYSYDDAGNITAITDRPDGGQPAEAQCFAYDYLTRITEAWTPASLDCAPAGRTVAGLGGPAKYWQSFTFDSAGNRKTETLHGTTNTVRTYTYPPSGKGAASRPHAVSQILTTSGTVTTPTKTENYAYDPAGNTTCRPALTTGNVCPGGTPAAKDNQALNWTDDGHLAKSTDKSGDTTYIYDADGNRLIRKDPTGSTLYLQGGTELRKPKTGDATATRYYSVSGNIIATRTPTALTWMVNDKHGTGTATVTNDGKLTANRQRTLPFGANRGTNPTAWAGDKGFVGGTKDNTGLTHLGAREYDPLIGKFTSVDPIQDLADPQQWNAYAYANDDPVNSSDPSGLWAIDPDLDDRYGRPRESGTGHSNHQSPTGASGTSPVHSGRGITDRDNVKPDSIDRFLGTMQDDIVGTVKGTWQNIQDVNECASFTPPGERTGACGRLGGVILGQGKLALATTGCQFGILFGCEYALDAIGCGDLVSAECAAHAAVLVGEIGVAHRFSGGRVIGCSFTAETPVLMADGTTRKIGDIDVGDEVLATDPENGKTAGKSVTLLHDDLDTEMANLTIVDAHGVRSTIHTTPNHPFWNATTTKWTRADELHRGDRLSTRTGSRATVVRVHLFEHQRHMLNLTVEDLHTYYVMVGKSPVLVHNDNGFPGTHWTGGNFPIGGSVDAGGPANGVLYRTQDGAVSNYAVYGPDGTIQYRVDLVGASHGGVDTPHYQPYEVNTNPKTGARYPKPTGEAFSGYGPDGAPRLGGC